ncbi:PglL family O-oligosaccharyltransferase [Rahnella woolbedingensis]|uniref:Polymerase n=1 Tax=Rahnella woolbedingensis TaxID=1510574 RepID=A0A419N1P7_9GAMM|nr:O-antigen ligase family protein [Rahnella woolbedingensis]RJT31439.1 hypothetical protein D6C13_24920 [Rahnella woolbedingensis]
MNPLVFYKKSVICLLGIYFIILMHVYQPNMGGSGLNLPGNIVGWLMITGIFFLAVAFSLGNRRLVVSRSLTLYIGAACLLAIPLLYPDVRWINIIERMLGLAGGIALYAVLQQCHVIKKNRTLVLSFILLSVWVEAVYALLQLFVFKAGNWMEFVPGTGAYGIFQQRNVLASYVATGAGIAAYLFIGRLYFVRRSSPHSAFLQKIIDAALLLSIFIFSFLIVMLSSRIGYLGGIAAIAVLLSVFGKKYPARAAAILCAVLAGGLTAKFALPDDWLKTLAHEDSNVQRMVMIKQSLAMIAAKPWLGWGYGGFEYHFQHFLAALQPAIPNYGLVKHPHNELLFWWVEGGIVALAGMVMLGAGYLQPLFSAFSRERLALWSLTLPIALHTMTEYPLYQSVAHYVVLILLLVMADSFRHRTVVLLSQNPRHFSGIRVIALMGLAGGILFFITGLQTNNVLTMAERNGLRDFSQAQKLMNPHIQWQRFEFDRHVNQLMVFNMTGDARHLLIYDAWAEKYSQTHVDPNVYLTRAKIARVLHNDAKAQELYREAQRLTPISRHGMVNLLKPAEG